MIRITIQIVRLLVVIHILLPTTMTLLPVNNKEMRGSAVSRLLLQAAVKLQIPQITRLTTHSEIQRPIIFLQIVARKVIVAQVIRIQMVLLVRLQTILHPAPQHLPIARQVMLQIALQPIHNQNTLILKRPFKMHILLDTARCTLPKMLLL